MLLKDKDDDIYFNPDDYPDYDLEPTPEELRESGAKSVFDIAPAMLSQKTPEELRKEYIEYLKADFIDCWRYFKIFAPFFWLHRRIYRILLHFHIIKRKIRKISVAEANQILCGMSLYEDESKKSEK